jgi:hypothetical protein
MREKEKWTIREKGRKSAEKEEIQKECMNVRMCHSVREREEKKCKDEYVFAKENERYAA